MKLKGTITISRYQGCGETGIAIHVEDALSHVTFLDIEISPESFGNAISGLASQNCMFRLTAIQNVGMKREYKEENVPYEGYAGDSVTKKKALAPFEKDGWRGSLEDLGNHHRQTTKGFRVGFVRYVETTQTLKHNHE